MTHRTIDRVEDVSAHSLRKIVAHIARGASPEDIAILRDMSLSVAQAVHAEVQWVYRAAGELGIVWRRNETWLQFRERVFRRAGTRIPLPIRRMRAPRRPKKPVVLSERDKAIWRDRQAGYTLREISARYDITFQRVQQLLKRVERAHTEPAEEDQKKAR